MTTIRIAEDERHPRHTEFADEANDAPAPENSIYNFRPLERSRTGRSGYSDDGIYNIRSRSRSRTNLRRLSFSSKDGNEEDEDPDLRRESDFKHKQVRLARTDQLRTH